MWALADDNRALLLARRDLLTRCWLTINGFYVETVPLIGGTITVDETATNRRTLTCQIANVDRWLPLLENPLAPTGVELVLHQAPRRTDGTAEDFIPVGVFGVRAPKATDTGGRTLTVEGRDRSQMGAHATFNGPYTIAAGTNTVDAILAVLAPAMTALGEHAVTTTTTTTTAALTFQDGDDRWQRATEMASADGLEVFFDAAGNLVIRPVPDPSTGVDWDWAYVEGPGALISAVTQSLDADQTYSHATAIGQNPDPTVAPVRGDAYDNDPGSPTYYLGAFGNRQVRLVSPFISTQAQADSAAAALLLRKSGLLENVSAVVYPNPAHEAGDVILIERLALGVLARYVLSRFDLPLGPGVSNLSTQARRVH